MTLKLAQLTWFICSSTPSAAKVNPKQPSEEQKTDGAQSFPGELEDGARGVHTTS